MSSAAQTTQIVQSDCSTDSTGRAVGEGAAPIHLLCLHVFTGQTENSCPTLEGCKASSVLVLKSQLKLHKGFNSISHLQSAIEKCKTAMHCVFLKQTVF